MSDSKDKLFRKLSSHIAHAIEPYNLEEQSWILNELALWAHNESNEIEETLNPERDEE